MKAGSSARCPALCDSVAPSSSSGCPARPSRSRAARAPAPPSSAELSRSIRSRRWTSVPELRQVRADRNVEVDLALVDQLQHQGAGPELGDRADLEERVRRRLDAGRGAEQSRRPVDDLPVVQDTPRRTRYPVVAEQAGKAGFQDVPDLCDRRHSGMVEAKTGLGVRRSERKCAARLVWPHNWPPRRRAGRFLSDFYMNRFRRPGRLARNAWLTNAYRDAPRTRCNPSRRGSVRRVPGPRGTRCTG